MNVATPLSSEIGSYLDLLSRRFSLITSNMANVDTPGYRTRDLDFSAAFHDAASGNSSAKLHSGAKEVGGLIQRPDGNDVSMDRESMAMAEVQLQFRTGAALMKREFALVHDAIKEDSK